MQHCLPSCLTPLPTVQGDVNSATPLITMDAILQTRKCETTKNDAVSDTVISERQSIAEAQLLREEIEKETEDAFPCNLPWQEYLNSWLSTML